MKARSQWFCGVLLALTASGVVAGENALGKVLKEREGKTATVILESGTELTGKVAEVSEHSVKLSELSGKEFYDAVINLGDVQAVLVRARDK